MFVQEEHEKVRLQDPIEGLGHINKKRIEKLQHDGILQPTDDESFDKCKSCRFGKMARKPFLHQTERAKDLLGLIYTDVCGTFITMPREACVKCRLGYFNMWMCISAIRQEDKHFTERMGGPYEPTLTQTLGMTKTSLNVSSRLDKSSMISLANGRASAEAPRSCHQRLGFSHKMGYTINNQVWHLVDLPLDDRTVESKWLFKKKTDMDGNVHTFKARLVAKAISSTEAESIAALEAAMKAVWIRKFIDGLRSVGARHYQRKYHYIREVKEMGEIILNKVNTDDNVVDLFIKPMSLTKHNEHVRSIGLRSASSHM
ncbi:retrotransposon protein, putative, ty1-copia subclass [Tanacetum coccineum]